MKYKIRLLLGICLFFGLGFQSFGAESSSSAVVLTIRFYDKRIYHLETDPVMVQLTLTNNGPAPFRFKMADERAFSVDFEVRTTTNREVPPADALVRKRSQSRQVYFREVLVEAGESFSFVEDLRDFSLFDKSGAYVVRARIYPELYYPDINIIEAARWNGDANVPPIESNRLPLTVRPRAIYGPDGTPLDLDVETNAVLVREKLSPDGVVGFMLTARQKEQWEKYFLYMDLESMISRDSYRRRQWAAESEEGRRRMIARYRSDLQAALVDGDIAAIPREFTIERTNYGAEEGTVTVLEFFTVGTYTERKRYTYYLRRLEEVWTIVDYSVVNLGTE